MLQLRDDLDRPVADRDADHGFSPRHAALVLAVLAALAVAAIAVFMTYDLRGSLAFALELRAKKVAGMALVGTALGVATVLFHTVSGNRILTPSLMGFDNLYLLIQTGAAFTFGTFAFLSVDVRLRFGLEVVVMMGFALALHRLFLGRARDDVVALLLVGVVLGGMFASLTDLVARLIDPNEYVTLQDQFFASFATVDEELLGVSALAVGAVLVYVWRRTARLDVLALGRDTAVGLGVDHTRTVDRVLMVVALLVSVATALVGPITFLGLLVSNLAYRLVGTFRHRWTLPSAALAGVVALIGAQFAIEEYFAFETRASIVISFIGGTYFIILLLREART